MFNNGKEKKEEGMKFSEVTKKMVGQLRKAAGLVEQETEDGSSQGRNQLTELPEAKKDVERAPQRTSRPQGKGRRSGRDLHTQQIERA